MLVQRLRGRLLRRLILAWFALFVGATAGSPIVSPSTLEAVCTAAHGGKIVLVNGSGDAVEGFLDLHCPLCSISEHRLDSRWSTFEAPSSLAHALVPRQRAHLASATAPPLPSRGPPSLLR
ncbi:MAG: DUF2946 domain-containing protein [Betaproteobacteria bacterium]|nr:DUF2946 domain-containing protein [Betaproteobacteria bacterium]